MEETRRWLIAEDDPGVRELLSLMLKKWEVDPLLFHDGTDVMAWLDTIEQGGAEDTLPELAILDYRMPGASGAEIAHRLRNYPLTQDMVIIIITAYRLFPQEIARIKELATPDLLLFKPLPSHSRFKEQIDALLAGK